MSKSLSMAPLLLAVIAAVLSASAWLPKTPAAVIGSSSAPAESYDLETAMTLAGKELPANVEEYYFFALFEVPVPVDEVTQLAEKMRTAADEHDFVGIAGPDAQRNRESFLAALGVDREHPLQGLTVIYVGPIEQRDELSRAVRARGAEIHYVTYPKYSPEV